MKSIFWAVVAVTLSMAGLASTSAAITIPYSELYNPGTSYLMSSATPGHVIHSWTFDLRDNAGWTIPGQVFNNGNITLYVSDDRGTGDGPEKATFTYETGTGLSDTNINAAGWNSIFVVDSSAFLDGLVTATLTDTLGDFYFESAELTVESNYGDEQTPIPEPSTIFLLGAGLCGIALWRKKQHA